MSQQIIQSHFDLLAEQKFMDVFLSLKRAVECTYMSYIFEEKESLKKISFLTNKEWQSIYITKDLIKNCPLLLTGRRQTIESPSKATILVWNDVTPSDRKQSQVNGMRSEFNIANGLSFSQEFWGVREMLAIAAEKSRHDFATEILTKHLEVVKNHSRRLRRIAIDSFVLNRYWLPTHVLAVQQYSPGRLIHQLH